MERRRVRFQGRVQGVGFRATARSIAEEFAVTGWVRNEQDGSVAMEVQGDECEVEGYLARLAAEMAGLIRSVDSCPIATRDGDSGFTIQR
jgi:acylphosphatase